MQSAAPVDFKGNRRDTEHSSGCAQYLAGCSPDVASSVFLIVYNTEVYCCINYSAHVHDTDLGVVLLKSIPKSMTSVLS